MHKPNLKISSLAYTCNKKKILDSIDLEINGHQIVVLLGPNGAGKSTLLKSISSQLTPDVGQVQLNHYCSQRNRKKYLSKIGFMPETACFFSELSVKEQLDLWAETKRVANAKLRINEVLEVCQLQSVKNKRTQQLSLGFKQRLNLAQALLNQPEVLLLDEPLNGLDPLMIIEFRNIIKKVSETSLVLLSTHYLSEAEMISDTVVIMMDGKIVDCILANTRTQKWKAKFNTEISQQLAQKISKNIACDIHQKSISFDGDESTAHRFLSLTSDGDGLYQLAPVHTSLESIYLEHTRGFNL